MLSLLGPEHCFFLGFLQLASQDGEREEAAYFPDATAPERRTPSRGRPAPPPLRGTIPELPSTPGAALRPAPHIGAAVLAPSLRCPCYRRLCSLLDPSHGTGAPGTLCSDTGHVFLLLPRLLPRTWALGFKSKQIPRSSGVQERLALVVWKERKH